MFEKNSLTFNPGWDHERNTLKEFQDVHQLQRTLKARGLKLGKEADETTDGPAYFSFVDPDGNPILVDQGVPKPKRSPDVSRAVIRRVYGPTHFIGMNQ
jgi:hypothetical protein